MTARLRPLVTAALLTGLALLAIPALAQVEPAPPTPAPLCIYPFSKNLCTGELARGTWGLPVCDTATGAGCNNLVGVGASFQAPLTTSGGLCGDPTGHLVPCDTAEDFTGLLVAEVDVRAQRHVTCKARGSWDGTFRIVDPVSGTNIARGDLVATLGMGTHRRAECHGGSCGEDCEGCHDVRYNPAAFLPWHIGSEGTLKGRVLFGRYAGCTFTASFQGDFDANGDSRGPLAPLGGWPFCGTLEGVLECPCCSGTGS